MSDKNKIEESPLLSFYASEIIHGHTTKDLGSDYQRISKVLNINSDNIVTLKQIHSNRVHVYQSSMKGSQEIIEGDALICNQPQIVIGVRTADCVPLLVYDPTKKVVAAIHAGWKGLIAGVIENTLNTMTQKFSSSLTDLLIEIGPCISESSFEVGPEVTTAFIKKFGTAFKIQKNKNGKDHIDLKKACYQILMDTGIDLQNIEVHDDCTFTDNHKWYSYRKGDNQGRILSFIGLV